MKSFPKISSLLLAAASLCATASADYKVIAHYPIGGDNSRFDYIVVDRPNNHIFAAHYKRFEVLDLTTGKKVGEIGPANRAHGVALVPELNRGFASSGNMDAVIMFDLKTLKTLSVIKTQGKDPDNVKYDEDTKKVYAVNAEGGTVAVIDPAAGAVEGLITVTDGKLEQIAFDGKGRAFINNEDKSCVHVVDTHARKLIDTWSSAPGEGGTGLVIDAEHHRLFSTCSNNKLVVLDSDSGKVVATPEIGEDADGVVFDSKTQRIFTSNSDGTMTVLHEDTPDTYTVLQSVKTALWAKTLGLDAETGHILLPSAKFGPLPAATKDVPEPRAPVIANTFEVLVVGE